MQKVTEASSWLFERIPGGHLPGKSRLVPNETLSDYTLFSCFPDCAFPEHTRNEKETHHTIGICVASFRHGETLDYFWSHPRESSNQGHVCGVVMESGGTKVTDLRKQRPTSIDCSNHQQQSPTCKSNN